jgi:hypothetical protein
VAAPRPAPARGWRARAPVLYAGAVAAYTLTVRRRGATERSRHATLDEALAALQARMDELAPRSRREAERALSRVVTPVAQVAVRAELSGPGVRGGVDLRGDGSTAAFTGRWRRVAVEQRGPGETALAALRRALSG